MISRLHIFLLLISPLFISALPTEQQCKTVPNSSNWPAPQDWETFNETLNGQLLKPHAPAAACHPGQPEYNTRVCSEITNSWDSSQWHSDNPVSNDWQNWNNYSCLPDPSLPCSSNGYPLYVVNASSSEHVQLAVNFAANNKLRLNVKSTGHDFLGRSTNPNSLSIWTHHLRGMTWHSTSFSPQNCGFNLNVSAVTVGAGTQMRDLYQAAADRNLMIVGGSSTTVSVGGYLTGGGHSPLSPLFGMGADNVIEFEIVTADGETLVANECSNVDLFWAVRGGGPAFGVITTFTIRAIPNLATTVYTGGIFGTVSSDANWDAVTYIHKQWPNKLSKIGAAGYMIGTPYLTDSSNFIEIEIILPNTTSTATLQAVLSPIFTQINQLTNGAVEVIGSYQQYAKYGDFMAPHTTSDDSTSFPGTGTTKLITSWLYDETALASPGLKSALMGSIDNSTLLYNDFTSGPGVHNPPFLRGGSNAVNPAWRSAIVRPAAEKNFPGLNIGLLSSSRQDFQRFGESLRQLAPSMGAYGNEADAFTLDYQTAFYGSNYERLLEIKKTVDPDGVFWCRTCVGSEMWVEGGDGSLCLAG